MRRHAEKCEASNYEWPLVSIETELTSCDDVMALPAVTSQSADTATSQRSKKQIGDFVLGPVSACVLRGTPPFHVSRCREPEGTFRQQRHAIRLTPLLVKYVRLLLRCSPVDVHQRL